MPEPVLLVDPPVADLDDHLARGGGAGLARARSLGPGATIQEVILSGLRGRGGGGFPTGRKWQSVRDAAAAGGGGGPERTFVVCNGAEGEPATFKDRALIRANPYAVVEGVAIAAFAVGAEGAYIGTKASFGPESERLATAVDEMTAAGLIGDVPVRVVLGPDDYLFGEETGLLQVIEGEAPLPRLVPPYIEGLFATVPGSGWTPPVEGVRPDELAASNPTVVNNVETLATVTQVLARGPEWHRSLGTARSPGVVVATVVGDVVRPGVGEVELGTPLRDVIERVGGGVTPGRTIKAVLPGVANPVIPGDALDAPCSYEGLEAIGSGMGAAGFWVLDDTTSIIEVAQAVSRFLAVESCGQCPACKLGCTAVTEGLDRLMAAAATPEDVEVMAYRLRTVTDGNRCYLPVQEQRVIGSVLATYVDEINDALDGTPPPTRGLEVPKIVDL